MIELSLKELNEGIEWLERSMGFVDNVEAAEPILIHLMELRELELSS